MSETGNADCSEDWPLQVFFVSTDLGEPPHIHVRQEGMVAKFRLDPVALQKAGGYGRSELSRIARLVIEHQGQLLESWNEFFGG